MAVDCVHSFFSLIHNLYIVSGAFQSLLMNLPCKLGLAAIQRVRPEAASMLEHA